MAVASTKKSSRRGLIPLGAGLLILGGSVPSWADEAPVAASTLLVEDGLVTLTADSVPVGDLIREIALRADLRLVQHVALQELVSVDFDRRPLADVLGELLRHNSYQLYQAADGPSEERSHAAIPGALWVFAEGATSAPEAMIYFEAVLLHGAIGEKKAAIRDLRRLATAEAVETLSIAVRDEDARVRKVALEALSRIGGDEALAAIASLTQDDEPQLRGRAVEAVGMAGGVSAADYLVISLDDDDPRVRAAAIESLADLGDERVLPFIRRGLNDPDAAVRERAVSVLEEFDDEAMFRALFPAE